MHSKIIVPIDGSPHSLNGLKFAVTLAEPTKDEIILLNVQPTVDPLILEQMTSKDLDEINSQLADKALKEAVNYLEELNAPYQTKIRTGISTIEIAAEAKETAARCIVMGTRGMGPDVSKALGSVSYGILHLSPCPLTFVPFKK